MPSLGNIGWRFTVRIHVGMLGVLCKCAHGVAHEDLLQLFPRDPGITRGGAETRRYVRRHDLQLRLRHHGTQRAEFHRSLFGLVKIWNLLPSSFVAQKTVSAFQSCVTELVQHAVSDDVENWQSMLSPPNVSSVFIKYVDAECLA